MKARTRTEELLRLPRQLREAAYASWAGTFAAIAACKSDHVRLFELLAEMPARERREIEAHAAARVMIEGAGDCDQLAAAAWVTGRRSATWGPPAWVAYCNRFAVPFDHAAAYGHLDDDEDDENGEGA